MTHPDSFFSVESIISQDDEVFLTNIIITESIIMDSIKELSANSAAGPDGIPASLLLNGVSELLILFKQSLDSGVIDPSLKKLQVPPFLSQVIEQFPVTSVIIKVFERVIRKQIVIFLIPKGHLNPTQHGCRVGIIIIITTFLPCCFYGESTL